MRVALVITFLASALCSIGYHQEFSFDIDSGQTICFRDDIAKETLFSLIVNPSDITFSGLSVELIGPNEKVIKKEQGKAPLKVMHSTQISGFYHFCIRNENIESTKVHFHLLQDAGMAYMEAILKSSEMPLYAEILSLGMKADHIKKLSELLTNLEDQNFLKKDAAFDLLPVLTITMVLIIMTLTFIQVKYLQKFFMEKKFI
jgi:emp24/gp25L/p24 family/GOLD.